MPFPVTGWVVLRHTWVPVNFCLVPCLLRLPSFICRASKLLLARVKTSFSCSAMYLKTKLVLAHVKTRNSARQNALFLFSFIFM